MVIKNSTPWRTEDIRKLFRRCVKEAEKKEQPKYNFHSKNKHFKLTLENGNNSNGSWGHAALGRTSYTGFSIYLKIGTREIEDYKPTDQSFLGDEMPFTDKQYLARVMIHEYYHSMGFMDFDKRNYKADSSKTWNVDWIKDYPIRKKEIMSKSQVDIKLQRYQLAINNLDRAETRLKRAKTIEKKWREKVNRYQKVYNYK